MAGDNQRGDVATAIAMTANNLAGGILRLLVNRGIITSSDAKVLLDELLAEARSTDGSGDPLAVQILELARSHFR